LQLWVHEHIKSLYERNTNLVYYDVTNYYFEIDEQDELRRKGVSKEHRPDPIVQMGLFMDTNGIPITYKLFPGNALDKTTLMPMLRKIQHDYSLGRIIVVADKGIITGDNIWYTFLPVMVMYSAILFVVPIRNFRIMFLMSMDTLRKVMVLELNQSFFLK